MSKKEKYNKDLVLQLKSEFKNPTAIAKEYAKRTGKEYCENIRKNVSKILLKNQEDKDKDLDNFTDTNQYGPTGLSPLSALKSDGTIMNIEEYCEQYGIPFDQVKTYKLVTHTGKGAYYNIASNTVVTETIESFLKDLLDEVGKLPNRPKTFKRPKCSGDYHLLVVDPADVHIGKLCDSFETGEEYNSQIAVQRVREGVEGIINKASGFQIDKVLFVGGNDILHIDNPKSSTTSGTHQNTDQMWYTNFLMAKDIYVEVIDRLLEVADVHFVFNPSNHDYMSGFFLADLIKTYYKDCKNITFDCTMAHRKYFVYHGNLIGTSHGDGGKLDGLPLMMAHEAKESWGTTNHKYIYLHHFHHKVSKDYGGVCVEALRSPSGTDSWHHRNQYQHAPKAIEGFIHHPTFGQIARLTHLF